VPQGELRPHLSMGPAGSSGCEFRPGRGLQGLRKAGGGPDEFVGKLQLVETGAFNGKAHTGRAQAVLRPAEAAGGGSSLLATAPPAVSRVRPAACMDGSGPYQHCRDPEHQLPSCHYPHRGHFSSAVY